MSKVSVIIPVYNTSEYLNKCLDSVCNQTLKDIEIICINDCSTDNSLEILKEYASKDERIKIIDFKENKGAAAARNAGIDIACGEYIGFVDSDDFVDLDFYEKLYKKANETGFDIIKSNLFFENYPNINKLDEYHNILEVRTNKLLLNHIPTTIIKKQLLYENRIRFPEIKNAEDTVFETLVSYYANNIVVIENTYYHYVFNNKSLNNSIMYSYQKIDGLICALNQILDFFNNIDIDRQLYCDILTYRFNTIVYLFLRKSEEIPVNIDEFTLKMDALRKKFKYQLNNLNFNDIEQANNILKILERPVTKHDHTLIPKRIFYMWFGCKKTALANVCIENWKDKLKSFEIIEVNENSPYFDFSKEYDNCKWFKTVYDRKMWAYVSDYVRAKVLYEHGGIYLDTDMTIYKDLDTLLNNGVFLGLEIPTIVSAGIIGAQKKHPLFKDLLNFYNNEIFNSPLYVITHIITNLLAINHYDDVKIYPKEYFYPFYGDENFTPECIKENTYAVHWWNSSWRDDKQEFFLENKHKIPIENIDEAYKRHCRLKEILKNNKK